jgi:hypothetical protein
MEGDWKNLKKLFLSFCHVGDEGAIAISKVDWPNI